MSFEYFYAYENSEKNTWNFVLRIEDGEKNM